jgi:hypothetical protein
MGGCHAATPVPPRDIPRATPTHPPVTPRDAPCPMPSQPPVTSRDTNKTLEETQNKTQKRPGRERATVYSRPSRQSAATTAYAPRAPGLTLVKNITGRMPPRAVQQRVLNALGPTPSVERLRTCYEEWCVRGYNPRNLAWLLEWYAGRSIPPNKPPGRTRYPALDDPAASPEEFARWHDYQQALQRGRIPMPRNDGLTCERWLADEDVRAPVRAVGPLGRARGMADEDVRAPVRSRDAPGRGDGYA